MKRSEAPKYTCQDSEEGILEQFTLEESIGFFLKSILYDSAILLFSNAPDLVEEEVVAALQHSLQTGLQHRRFDRYSLFCQHTCPVTQALDKPKTSPADFYCQVSCPT